MSDKVPPSKWFLDRRFWARARRALGLVLLVLEIVQRVLDLLK